MLYSTTVKEKLTQFYSIATTFPLLLIVKKRNFSISGDIYKENIKHKENINSIVNRFDNLLYFKVLVGGYSNN